MPLFSRAVEPQAATENQQMLTAATTRARDLLASTQDRALARDGRNAVGDAAEAVRMAQYALHLAIAGALEDGRSMSELATEAGTTEEYLRPAYDGYDVEDRIMRRPGWRPLG
jgi:hypothetical protein